MFLIFIYLVLAAYSDKCHIGFRSTLAAHEAPVWQCNFSTNGKLLASWYTELNFY